MSWTIPESLCGFNKVDVFRYLCVVQNFCWLKLINQENIVLFWKLHGGTTNGVWLGGNVGEDTNIFYDVSCMNCVKWRPFPKMSTKQALGLAVNQRWGHAFAELDDSFDGTHCNFLTIVDWLLSLHQH